MALGGLHAWQGRGQLPEEGLDVEARLKEEEREDYGGGGELMVRREDASKDGTSRKE